MVLAAALIAAPVMGASLRYELVPLDRLPAPTPMAVAERPPGILPDGVVATGTGTIRAAWLTGPTRRYAHGVLGDDVEASGLAVRMAAGETLSMTLHHDAVFEDRIPRLVDLNGDGRDEVLVVKSTQSSGAALALIAPVDGRLRQIAEGEPIGLAYRWLNPVGVGDFDGDGRIETAHVETPHIGGSLVLSRLEGDRLVEIRREGGFSNHRMGSRVLGLSMVLDADGDGVPDLLVPDNPRTSLRVVTFAGGSFRELARIDLGAEIRSSLRRATLADGRRGVAFELSDGRKLALVFRR
jgi:hypothetical protein